MQKFIGFFVGEVLKMRYVNGLKMVVTQLSTVHFLQALFYACFLGLG